MRINMKYTICSLCTVFCVLFFLPATGQQIHSNFDSVSRVATGTPVSVMLTSYSTTVKVNARTRLRIAVTDSEGKEITSAMDSIRVYVTGNGKVTGSGKNTITTQTDTAGVEYTACQLRDGLCYLNFVAGDTPDKVKVEARSGKLWPGSHEIHTLPADVKSMKPTPAQTPRSKKRIGRMIGADISWLPQLEDQGKNFIEDGAEVDAIALLHAHGFNTIRLRIFVNPENEKGYAPMKGYCDLAQTLAMAKRIKDADMQLLLDFHYSDYWADPQQQYKPQRWADLDFKALKDSVQAYTAYVLKSLEQQGTPATMVQIGNEINHGLLWPDGHISHPDQLAGLLRAGVEGAKSVNPDMPVMMHIALGGQNDEAVFWLDNMLARGVTFDIIGLSYYPRWHGTLEDLQQNLQDLAVRYHKPLNVVEYSNYKREVHDMIFGLPSDLGKGACIWEPLNARSGLFTREGEVTELMSVYDTLSVEYIRKTR
jgi:beta-galactosidase